MSPVIWIRLMSPVIWMFDESGDLDKVDESGDLDMVDESGNLDKFLSFWIRFCSDVVSITAVLAAWPQRN